MNRFERLRKRLMERFWGRAFLRLLSWAYGAGVFLRRTLYRLRILPSRRLHAKTICIGNLTTGGTGKTSAVLLAAETLHKHHVKVAILSRGYKRPKALREIQVLMDDKTQSWQNAGDEPWMMHQTLKGMEIPILVSPDRYRAGQEALHYYSSKALLLDDGFQHFKLHLDLDILLVNATDPFGGGHLLPLGNLREPLSGARRAKMIVLTHCDRVEPKRLAEIHEALGHIHPKAHVLEAVHRPSFIMDIKTQAKHRLTHIKGKSVAAFSAIGDPASFEHQLRNLEADILQAWRYPDHHRYTLEELRSIDAICNDALVVTTFKDAARLPPEWPQAFGGEILALGVQLEITKGKDAWETELCKGLRHD